MMLANLKYNGSLYFCNIILLFVALKRFSHYFTDATSILLHIAPKSYCIGFFRG